MLVLAAEAFGLVGVERELLDVGPVEHLLEMLRIRLDIDIAMPDGRIEPARRARVGHRSSVRAAELAAAAARQHLEPRLSFPAPVAGLG